MTRTRFARPVTVLAATLVGFVLASGVASAHVRYVTSTEQVGEGLAFLSAALTDPVNSAALAGGGVALSAAIVTYRRVHVFDRDVAAFRAVMAEYRDLLPWLLRLGFGLPLVGAGFAGYFLNPVVDPLIGGGVDRLLQILLGFLIIFGFGTRVAASVGLLAYLIALPVAPLLVYSLEWIPGFLALVLVGSGRPSADHVFERVASTPGTFYSEVDPIRRVVEWGTDRLDPLERYIPTVIRVGMGIGFAFLGLFEKLLAPEMARGVVEQYGLSTATPIPPDLWVLGAGFGEIAIGVAIAVGFFTRASAMAALFVFTLTLFGIPDDPVLAHIGLFSLASALLITGSGPYALDNYLTNPRRAPADSDSKPAAGSAEPSDD
ncbi:DoxX family protein [Halorubrum laminariae]|uniref:DoxX family protein n=1 Tax=Halorubrum laminariae TaxID=1433523 RepID=A0ABD6BXZ9_9EURY|nr:DoxX family protein [Halorubrum laminariae]